MTFTDGVRHPSILKNVDQLQIIAGSCSVLHAELALLKLCHTAQNFLLLLSSWYPLDIGRVIPVDFLLVGGLVGQVSF